MKTYLYVYQLKHITIVLSDNVLVENNCHIFPVEGVSSASNKCSESTARLLWFLFANLVSILFASFFLPLLSSQRGDSGIKLKIKSMRKSHRMYGISTNIYDIITSLP